MVSNNVSNVVSTSGNSSTTPIWKLLGYSSYQNYLNATSGQSLLANYASVASKIPTSVATPSTVTVKTPSVTTINTGSGGTVTDEGVIVGGGGSADNVTFNSNTPTTTTVTPTTPTTPTVASATANAASNTATTSEEDTSETTARTDEGSYNGTSDFLEWYKENYGTDYDSSVGFTRREGMSDAVYAAGQILYSNYLQGLEDETNKTTAEETLASYYQALQDSLSASKKQSQQTASITLDKLKKYLPTQIKAQGLGGLGVSESTLLKAYNNYANEMGSIESDYNSNKTTLDTSYSSELQDIADKYNEAASTRNSTAASNALSQYQTLIAQYEEQLRQYFEDAYSTISNSTSTSADEIMSYVEQYKDKLSDSDYQTLVQYANTIAQNNLKSQQDSEKSSLYSEVASSLQTLAESLLGDDGKMSASDYQTLADYISKYSSNLGDSYTNQLNAILEGYSSYVRSDSEQAELDAQNDYYSVKTVDGVVFNNNNGWWIFGQTDFSNGDNFSVTDSSGYKYRIESGGEVSDSDITSAATTLSDGTVFGYGGQIYIKYNGKIYLIQARANSYKDHYKKLYALFYS